jgi:DNA-binding transcriptional LysR family regulator
MFGSLQLFQIQFPWHLTTLPCILKMHSFDDFHNRSAWDMDLQHVRNFLRVTEAGSITAAAKAVMLTQPALTRQIRALEKHLGVVLFERSRKGMHLTEAGGALTEYARRLESLTSDCARHMRDLHDGQTGQLVLGAGVTTSIFHLPTWLRKFQARWPRIDVVVRTGSSNEIAGMIMERTVDLGFVTSEIERPELCTLPLLDDEIVLVSSNRAGTKVISRNDFRTAPLILFPRGTGFREFIDRELAKANLAAYVKMESDSVEAIKAFVAMGLGMAFLPAIAVGTSHGSDDLRRRKLEGLPKLNRSTKMIYRADRPLSTAARTFVTLCKREQ